MIQFVPSLARQVLSVSLTVSLCQAGNKLNHARTMRVSDTESACLACREILSPILGVSGGGVVPHERRDSNGSALVVHQGKDAVSQIRTHTS